MSCILKNIPPEDFVIIGNGNRGSRFPVVTECDVPIQDPEDWCFLALEEGTWPEDPLSICPYLNENQISPYNVFDDVDIVNTFAAPCIIEEEKEEVCYLALQENGYTAIVTQELGDFFVLNC